MSEETRTNAERPTPITDAMVGYDPSWNGMVPADFARDLERKLAEANHRADINARDWQRQCLKSADLERQLAEAREENEQLKRWTSVNGVSELTRELAEVRENMQIERERGDDAGAKWKQSTEALAEMREENARLRGPDDTGDDSLYNVRRLRANIVDLTAQRDRLAEALDQLKPFAPNNLWEDQHEIHVWEQSMKTLAAVKGEQQ